MDTQEHVIQIVAETLNLSTSEINESSAMENLELWDSMAQVNLMMSIEQTFDLELDPEDFMKLNSVSNIVEYLDNQ